MHDFSVAALKADVLKVLATPDAARWALANPAPLEVWATMNSARATDEKYQVRLLWSVYPDAAPSLKFRDLGSGRLDLATAWPVVRGFRPGSLDACVNYCSEGLALHPEWTRDPNFRWDPNGNVLLKILRILQDELDDHYQGRFSG